MGNITPLDIQQVEFKKTMRGYSEEEVRAFLLDIAEEFKALIEENENLKKELDFSKNKMQRYKDLEDQLQNSLILLQNIEKDKLKSVQREAEMIIKNAELEAENIIQDAKIKTANLKQEVMNLKEKKIGLIVELQGIIKKYSDLLEIELEDMKEKKEINNSK